MGEEARSAAEAIRPIRVGWLIGQDKWTPVQASGLRVSVAPRPKGGAISLRFAF